MTLDFLPTETAEVSPETLAEALAELRVIVGDDGVVEGDGGEFRDPFQPESWTAFWPGAVVQPTTVDQVRAIVRAANRHGIPLWTQGQGRNNGYGGAGPRVSGGITLNFRRMNKVLEIDEDLAYAEVEPGVSFQELHDEIRRQGKRLMVAVPDLGWGGAVSNALDNGMTYTPVGKDFMNLCGLEVVTAEGDLLRTNMGAQEGNAAWHLYRRSFGPSLDTLFTQSNLGIVTKAGIWLQTAPETIHNVHVDVWREEDLIPLVDILRRLRLDGTVDGVPCILNTLLLAVTMGKRSDYAEVTGDADESVPLTDAQIDAIARHLDIGRWHLRFSLYGDEAVVDHHFEKAKRAFSAIEGARIVGSKTTWDDAPGVQNPSDKVYSGIPNLDWKDMGGWYGGSHGGHMSFAPVVPLDGRTEYETHRWMREFFEARGCDYTSDIIVINARSSSNVAGFSFDIHNLEETERGYRTLQDLVRAGGERGLAEYRAHPHYMDIAADVFDFNDHAYRRFVERIKDAVDPNGILSPGKQGIWPGRYRR